MKMSCLTHVTPLLFQSYIQKDVEPCQSQCRSVRLVVAACCGLFSMGFSSSLDWIHRILADFLDHSRCAQHNNTALLLTRLR
jgi:hypothetical protein